VTATLIHLPPNHAPASLRQYLCGGSVSRRLESVTLGGGPDSSGIDNAAENEDQLKRLRTSVGRGRPFGRVEWQQRVAKERRLESSYGEPGRPKRFKRS
jgi:hypothetical protein